MKTIILILTLFANLIIDCATAGGVEGLCETSEQAFFSCKTANGRWIAVCGANSKVLQYRYGKPGKVELRYPGNPLQAPEQLLFAHYFRYQTDKIEISFKNQGVDYAIFDYSVDRQREAGVRVATADGQEREIRCTGSITDRLGELSDTLRCDADNALNIGGCPSR